MKKDDVFPSKWLSAKDVADAADDNDELILTISDVKSEKVGQDQKPVMYFSRKEQRLHGGKALVVNVTNWNILEGMFGDESDDWKGQKVTLGVEKVNFQGNMVPSIRIKEQRKRKAGTKVSTAPAVNQDADDPGGDDDSEDD